MGRSNRSRASTAAGRRRANARVGKRTESHPRPNRSSSRPAPKRPAQPKRRRKATKRAATSSPRQSNGQPPRRRRPSRASRRSRGPAGGGREGFTWPQRLVLLACVLAVAAGGYLLWFRDSSLVAVDDVEVVGVTTDRDAIATELTRVGEQMTTLHVDRAAIERAAKAFPTIESVSVDANFPHGLRIEVTERPPAVVVRTGGEEIPAAADGTLLGGVSAPTGELPAIEVGQLPGGKALTGDAREQAIVAGSVPDALRPLIEAVSSSDDHGVEITLRGGIPAYFGDGDDAAAKWEALAAVLADPELDYARYVDVRVPARPTVGQDGPVTSPAATNPPA